MPVLSRKVKKIAESQTVALTSLMEKLKQQGRDIVTLGAGEPDFDTPNFIKDAAISAINSGFTKYTPVEGIFELKESICGWLKSEYAARYKPSEIIITPGAKFAVYQALVAVCNPGDEVLLPTPYWVSYPEQIKLVGAKAVPLKTDEETGMKITPGLLKKAITSKTKALILNSPGNPSGAVYTREELAALVSVIKESGIYILSDEVYDQIIYDGQKFTSLAEFEDIRDQLLLVNGVSKSFAMTGWRIGFLAAHKDIIAAVKKHQGHTTSNPTSVSQKAAVAAYGLEKHFLKEMKTAFAQRRDYVFERLNGIKKVSCIKPQGAFYAFPNLSFYCGRKKNGVTITNSMELCTYLLEVYDVAIVPGSAFGMENHARLSFATSMQILEKALDRIESGLLSLS